MELSEHKAAIHPKKQPKLFDKKFLSYSFLTFRRAQAHLGPSCDLFDSVKEIKP